MKFNENLKFLRKQAKLTQEELAEKLNVSRQAVTKWESGQAMPDIVNLKEIAYLFSVTTDSLLEDIECRGTSKLKKKINELGWFALGYILLAIFMVIIPISGFIEEVTKDTGLASMSIIVMALIAMILLVVSIKKYLTDNKKKILNMSQTEEGKTERRKYCIKQVISIFVTLIVIFSVSDITFITKGANVFMQQFVYNLAVSAFWTAVCGAIIIMNLSKKVKELNK